MIDLVAAAPEPSESGVTIEGAKADPLLPRITRRRDRLLTPLVLISLLAHVAVVAPSLFHREREAPKPQEIPVDLVQLPPPKPPEPKVQPAKPAPPTSQAPKSEAPKPEKPKPDGSKDTPAKPKPPTPKPPLAPKPAPMKQSVAKPPQKAEPQKQESPSRVKETMPSGDERFKSLIGGMPALPLPDATATGTDQVSYTQLVLSRVAKAKKEGRFRGMPGAASVSFTIDDKGDLARVDLVRPSGIPDLDAEAVAMIRRGAPYPPPPPGGRRDYTITLRFQPLI